MLHLSEKTLVGTGLHRQVHVHPENPYRCIKVVVNGNQKETWREQYYYRFLSSRNINWISLPRFYGNVDTNMGSGAVFDLVRDSNENVSKTLQHYLNDEIVLAPLADDVRKALSDLKQDLLDQNIITMSLHPKNMVIQLSENKLKCLIIDNIGTSEFLPLTIRFKWFGRRRIERKWKRFVELLGTKFNFQL